MGDRGHLLTNAHCVQNAAEAKHTQVEMMAEGATCETSCESWFACPGNVVATSTTLLDSDAENDFALLKVKSDLSAFGYLKVRTTGPVLGERIYIPQYPKGWGKRLVVESSYPSDQSGPTPGFAHINSLKSASCSGSGNSEIGYYADTDHGASGSPVIAVSDNLVVALHHCGGCANLAIPIDRIVPTLRKYLPATAFAP